MSGIKQNKNNKNFTVDLRSSKIFIILILFFGFVSIALADVKYNLIQPLPGIQSTPSFPDYIVKIIPIILGLAAVLAVVKIVWAGIRWGASLGNASAITEAKEDIWQAILGLALAIASWLILNTINPNLVNLNFFPTPIVIAPEVIAPHTRNNGGKCNTKADCISPGYCIDNEQLGRVCTGVPVQ